MYYAKRNKPVRERQISYDFTHMWNLRNTTDEHRGKGWKNKIRLEREARDLNTENKLRIARRAVGREIS